MLLCSNTSPASGTFPGMAHATEYDSEEQFGAGTSLKSNIKAEREFLTR